MTINDLGKQRQLENLRENLRLVEERMSEYVVSTDIPLGLIKEKRRLEEQIADLETELAHGREQERVRREGHPQRRPVPVWVWLLGALVVVVIAGAVAFWAELREWYTDLQDMSQAEAMEVANMHIEADAFDAIPFRNVGSERQYIAVLAKSDPYQQSQGYLGYETVYLLEGSGSLYQKRNLGLFEFSRAGFGVIDVDDDGYREIYTVSKTGGSSGYGFTVRVYDTLDDETYSLDSWGTYSDPALEFSFSENVPQKKGLEQWLLRKGNEHNHFYKNGDEHSAAIEDWLKTHRRGFYKGQLTIHEFPGEIPPIEATVMCAVDDGEFEWISYFRGHVLGYDKSGDAYFVLYVPIYGLAYVPTMVSGEQYLWLGTCIEHGILAYNKDSHILEIVPAPELAETSDYSELYLRVEDTTLFDGRTRLTLPDHIDVEDEFQAATECEESS